MKPFIVAFVMVLILLVFHGICSLAGMYYHIVDSGQLFRYSDNNGIKDQETDWMRDPEVKGNGAFKPYGKVKTADDNNNFKVMKDKKHFSET